MIDCFPEVSQHLLTLGTEFKPRARQQLKIISSDSFQMSSPEECNFKGHLRSSEYRKMEVERGRSTGPPVISTYHQPIRVYLTISKQIFWLNLS